VSLFTDISTEMLVPALPLFLTTVLGAPMTVVGLIEGIAESTASVLRSFAGWLSDRAGRRKPLLVFGYSLSNITKPLLALTGSWEQVLLVRFVDRLGKGLRGAPRDALIADSVAPEQRGLAFGFHRSLDTVGAALGPLVAFAVLATRPEDYRAVFWIATIPGALAILIAGFFVRDLPRFPQARLLPRVTIRGLGRPFAIFTAIITLFALGNSSDAFLILRAKNLGMPTATIPLAYFGFNVVYASLSTPAGALSDRWGRRRVLIVGYVVFALVYLGFAVASGPSGRWTAWLLFLVYGTYYALTEGIQRAFIVDLVRPESLATALGVFASATGLALLPASLVAGLLWDRVGPSAPFFYGGVMAASAALLLTIDRGTATPSDV
jgi:MFS family permease